jgi:hypothetical protein
MPLTPALHTQPCHRHPESASSTGCRWCAELTALRSFRCARCGQMTLICHRCDRGQIYCARGCARTARRESLRRAGARYQHSPRGLRKHAASQARYRRKQQKKVTHQGSSLPGALVKPSRSGETTEPARKEPDVQHAASFPQPLARAPVPATPQSTTTPESKPAAKEALVRSETGEYVCDFCGQVRSRYLRQEPLFRIRRRLRGRPP